MERLLGALQVLMVLAGPCWVSRSHHGSGPGSRGQAPPDPLRVPGGVARGRAVPPAPQPFCHHQPGGPGPLPALRHPQLLLHLRPRAQEASPVPGGWSGVFLSMLSFLFFTDMGIYWIHRGLHHKLFYKRFHKPHHLWKIATPFASHAFHPVDGFMQSLPYHVYPFLFPLHKVTYLGLYIFVNVWTISIHDGDYRVPRLLRHVINGSAHHTDHHLYFDYNYGQYFTLWDKIGGSYKSPTSFEGKGPHDYMRKLREKDPGASNGVVASKKDAGASNGVVASKTE
ncbi:lathosterol oxidase isoform 3-T5 [Sylvia borin]